jgi:hypothetical protein
VKSYKNLKYPTDNYTIPGYIITNFQGVLQLLSRVYFPIIEVIIEKRVEDFEVFEAKIASVRFLSQWQIYSK